MNFKPYIFRYLLVGYAALLCLLIAPHAYALQSEEDALKAAFVYNFSLFTTWPQLNDTINFCVIGEVAQLSALKQYEGRNVSNASVRVKKVETIEEARACEVLFIQTNNQARANELYQALAGFPVLTVAEYRAFAQPAAIILFVQTNNRLAFEVNHTVAVEAQLSLSYKLLRLARKVNMTAP